MEEIKVGEYVRSSVNGEISKVLEVSDLLEEPNVKYYRTGKFTGFCSTENYNVKHSPNIIDLIEKGDYVNGTEVVTVYGYDEDGNDKDELGIIEVVGEEAYGIYLTDIKKIKDIVTKEQFNQMKYIVGDE